MTPRQKLAEIAGRFCGHEVERVLSPVIEDPKGDTYRAALSRLQNRPTLTAPAYLKRRDGVDWSQVDKDLQAFALSFVGRMATYGVPVFVHGAWRSDAEQDALYAQGVTKARAGQSAHNLGCAVDIVHYGRYWDLTRKEWDLFGALGKDIANTRNLKLTWGGDFKSFWDPAHWELTDWRSRVPS